MSESDMRGPHRPLHFKIILCVQQTCGTTLFIIFLRYN
jgi:hypothetical protein